MVPRRPPRPCCRADSVQVETLTTQQVRRVCTADSVSALASDPQTAGADPAGLAWSAICCTLIYLIIIGRLYRAAVLPCVASGVALVSGICWRCCGAVIRPSVAQVVLYPFVSVWYIRRLNWTNRRRSHCKALCAVLRHVRYSCMDRAKHAVNACIGLYCNRAK